MTHVATTREAEIAEMDEATRARYEEERAAILHHMAASARAVMGGEQAAAAAAATVAQPAADDGGGGGGGGEKTAPEVSPEVSRSAAPAFVRGGHSPSASLDSAVAAAADALRLDPDASIRTSASDTGA